MWGTIIAIACFTLFFGGLGYVLFMAGPDSEGEDPHCVDWHRRNGKYRVRYPDGQVSQPFTYRVARDYAKIFNGTVERIP